LACSSYVARPEHALQAQRADALLWLTTYQTVANQLVSGVRVPAKIVAAVTDVSRRHALQRRRPSALCHQPPSTTPQNRQTNPSLQRRRSR
jgi:hypothetical protein